MLRTSSRPTCFRCLLIKLMANSHALTDFSVMSLGRPLRLRVWPARESMRRKTVGPMLYSAETALWSCVQDRVGSAIDKSEANLFTRRSSDWLKLRRLGRGRSFNVTSSSICQGEQRGNNGLPPQTAHSVGGSATDVLSFAPKNRKL